MSTVERPIVVGVFEEESQARRAIDELKHAGFGSDQIAVAMPGKELEIRRVLDTLVNAEMPEEEIGYCEREFQAGHAIVSVRHDGCHWQAASILYGGRIYRYVKRLEGHKGAFPVSHASVLSEEPPFQMLMEKIEDAESSWKKLLIDAGLDKVLDDFD